MAEIKVLLDEYGIIHEACKILPTDGFKIKFLEALGELEDNNAHKTRQFPKTRLHKVVGIKQAVYRADIDKISGWRIHLQYIDKQIHLKDIIDGKNHDEVINVIRSKNDRYS
jgi:hypothetical protein